MAAAKKKTAAKRSPAKRSPAKRSPAKRKTRVMTKKTQVSKSSKKPINMSAVSTYIVVFSVFLFILAAGVSKIYMANITSDYQNKSDEISQEMGMIEKERQNLMTQQEELMRGEVILPKAKSLGLHPPAPGSVRKMPPSNNFKKIREMVSENDTE